jgi:zinc transport system substrate-binding protein
MVRQIGGDYVDVTCVLPAGASPHTFEPKPSLVRQFSSARIFFAIGAGLEFWAEKFVTSSDNPIMTVMLSQGVSLIHTAGDHHDTEHHSNRSHVPNHHSKAANPHIWLDPGIAKSMVNKISLALCEVDQPRRAYYKQREQKYLDELNGLHRRIKATVENFRTKEYVSFHASWDYFARRYGLIPVGVIEETPGRNPTPIQIMNIVASIKKYRIRAVFAEPQLNPKAAEVIAKEAGVRVLLLDPVGGPTLKKRGTYLDMMSYNLNVLMEAMK